MKPLLLSYRWVLLIAVSASMFLLLKINKRSFYFHYFKVIEEVEMRNSQELQTKAVSIRIWTEELKEAIGSVTPFLLTLVALGFSMILVFDQWHKQTTEEVQLLPTTERANFLPPVRAP